MGQAILELMQFILDLVLVVPKFVNWVLVALVELLLAIMPTSSGLGIPMPSTLLNSAAAAYPFFPWSIVADLFGVGLSVLGGVLAWKAFAAIWP